MIKANELRVGNWIDFHNFIMPKEYIQVNARFFSSLAGGRAVSEMKPDEEFNNYWQPIPLTPEILEKCGFKKTRFNTEWEWSIKSSECNWQKFDFNESALGKYYFWTVQKVVELKYLHQLQNLHFALTQTELQITL